MPESPLVQKETVALAELETLIAARAKGESETELGFRKRIDREEVEYRTSAKHLVDKYKVDNAAMEADYSRAKDQVVQTFQRDTQATKNEYEQTKKQIDDQLKKDTRKAKKSKEETGWQALAMFEGQRDEGIKWRRGTEAAWNEEISFLHQKQADAEYVLKRCGRLANATLEEVPATAAAAPVEATAPAEAAESAPADAAETGEPPVEQTPLLTLQSLRAQIEEHLVALLELRLPKFLKIDNFIWPWLLIGGAVAAGLGFGTGVGWMIAGIAGGVAAVASGVGAYIGLSLNGPPECGQAQRAAPARPRRLGEARRREVKTGSRTNSTESSRSSKRSARPWCATRRKLLDSPRRASFRAATRSRWKRPTTPTRLGSTRFVCAATKGSRRPMNIFRRASPHSRKSTRKIAASSTILTGRPKKPPSSITTRHGIT